MRRRFALGIACAFALIAGACGPAATATPSGGAPAGEAVNLVVGVQGNLSIKRQGWTDYAPALFGMIVRSGDLLRLDSTAQATVACSDLTLVKAASGVGGVPCKVSKPLLVYGSSLIIPTRADTPEGIPLILSPRKTKVMNARPLLRWQAVSGVTTYKVSIIGPNLNWSSEVSGKTELAYPDNAPALAGGSAYKLSVSGGNRSSDEEPGPNLGFTMLKADEAQVVREGEARIRALSLADTATRLLIANLYAGQGLNAEAIEQLEGIALTVQEPAVVRALGDLYMKVGLNRLAEQSYIQALDLSQKANDIEGQAAAQNALSLVYEAIGNKAEALQRGQKAVEWYQKLGDSQTVKQIQDRLATLQK